MSRETQTITEVREQETANSLKWIGVGALIMLFAFLMIYILGVYLKDNPRMLSSMRMGMGLGVVAGGAVIIGGLYKLSQLRNLASVTFPCPYCDAANHLVAKPESDFECETCHQTVRFDNAGNMLPVKIISCPTCNTDNRISTKSTRFICSKCNNTVQVQAEQPVYGMGQPAAPAPTPRPVMLLTHSNFDVLIQSFDPNRENLLAQSLVNILGVEVPEARRLLSTVNDRMPLIVGVDLPQSETEPLQAQLTQLGAKVHLRSR